MDLGITGKTAIVGAASKGLGKGCAMALAQEGVNLVINARTADVLEATAQEIRDLTGVSVAAVACDINTPEGRKATLSALEAQLLGHVEMITQVVDGMAERGFGRIVNITSSSVKMPVENLGLSTAARMALTGFASTISREFVEHNVIINNLLPGPFDTDRLRGGIGFAAEKAGASFDDTYEQRRQRNPAKRFGTAEEFGKVCAFLCSSHVGFMVGQNLLMDGGNYAGNF